MQSMPEQQQLLNLCDSCCLTPVVYSSSGRGWRKDFFSNVEESRGLQSAANLRAGWMGASIALDFCVPV
ncbi:hypothetical protein C0J52_12399 [Blattella germanica]|nr:hypothetical protein C0J52_12399 [Blattella germanica]